MSKWQKRRIGGGKILFWNNEEHTQMMYNPNDTTGALYFKDDDGNEYIGCWSSRPEVVRKYADPSFVGRNEYVDADGVVWYINLFEQNGAKYSENDAGLPVQTDELLRHRGVRK